jgi:4-carboxymuconolactone decarboxylase
MRLSVLLLSFVAMAAAQTQSPSSLKLRGDRFAPLTYDQMTPEQKDLTDKALSGKLEGGTSGAFNVLLRSPQTAALLKEFATGLHEHSAVPAKLNEMAILITVRYWTAQFPWGTHSRLARRAGLSGGIIDAIAAGKQPPLPQPDEAAVYAFCTELLKTRTVSDPTFQAAKKALGERGMVEMIGTVAYYQMVSMILNVDRYPLPDGAKPLLQPIE